MSSYVKSLSDVFKDWKKAVLTVIFTVTRLIYGWDWVKAGWEKLPWLTNGKENSSKMIQVMIGNIAHSHGSDPLHLNSLISWGAQNVFLKMPHVTDVLVVIFEIGVGLFIILGFEVLWTVLVAMFLNLQYAAAGAANNFGYIWTNVAYLEFRKYVGLIGIDGIIRAKKGKDLV